MFAMIIAPVFLFPALALLFFAFSGLKQINQYERGVVFTMGKYDKTIGPGWHIVWPIFQTWQRVDMRTKVVEEPEQEAITKDNVSTKISAVVYYKVIDASKTVLEVENLYWAVSQLAQTTMRNVVGEVSLDELLTKRHELAVRIKDVIDRSCRGWGVDTTSVELKDIKLPGNMIRTMAKQAEAERERRATIIKSEGEVTASNNLAKAAKNMASVPGALHLRTLSSLNDISSDQSNTIVFAVPLEVLRALEGLVKSK